MRLLELGDRIHKGPYQSGIDGSARTFDPRTDMNPPGPDLGQRIRDVPRR